MYVGVLLHPGDLKLKNAPTATNLMTTTRDSTGCCTALTGESLDCHTSLSGEPAEWEKKYRVKYKVRSLMNHLVEGPVSCSTPRPGTNGVTSSVMETIRVPGDLNILMKKVKDLWDTEAEIEEMKFVERYVCKYFFKLKMNRKL